MNSVKHGFADLLVPAAAPHVTDQTEAQKVNGLFEDIITTTEMIPSFLCRWVLRPKHVASLLGCGKFLGSGAG